MAFESVAILDSLIASLKVGLPLYRDGGPEVDPGSSGDLNALRRCWCERGDTKPHVDASCVSVLLSNPRVKARRASPP